MPAPKRWLTLSAGYVTTIVGGTEMYVHRLNRALLGRGVDAHACFYSDAPMPESVDGVAKPGAFRLLFAGRVSDIKGAHVVVDAVQHQLAGENVALALMGTAPTPSFGHAMERAVARDERMRWYPPQPEAACLGAQLACDAVVVPSVSPETGPYSVLEAQWLGATIIGSERAGIAQLLRDYPRGFLFSPSEPKALADAVRRASRGPQDKVAFDRPGYAARFDQALDALLIRVCPNASRQ